MNIGEGETVKDSAIEVIAEALHEVDEQDVGGSVHPLRECYDAAAETYRRNARAAISALEAAGFRVFRPENCEQIVVDDGLGVDSGPWLMRVDWVVGEASLETSLPDGVYALVPVEGETK